MQGAGGGGRENGEMGRVQKRRPRKVGEEEERKGEEGRVNGWQVEGQGEGAEMHAEREAGRVKRRKKGEGERKGRREGRK